MSELKAIFFDQDGVIIDTERDGHRVSFNQTFKDFGIPCEWDVDEYHGLLKVAGGKERMKHYFQSKGIQIAKTAEEEDELIARLHKHKTEAFITLIESGQLSLRPGVHRFMKEAQDLGLKMAICTTSNERAAAVISQKVLADIHFDFILAGDIVSKKKPDPEIYLLALSKAGLSPDECIVVEDSRNGLMAAKAAGMRVVATTNPYTEKEDLHEAEIIVTCLGDESGEKGKLVMSSKSFAHPYDGVLRVKDLTAYFG